jgi:signal transduction histidine kinase
MGPQERKIFITFAYVIVFVAVVISYFLIYTFFQQRKYLKLEKEKLNAEINASEQERNLIATELHNDIGPLLASLKMRLDLIETTNAADIESCKDALDKCVGQIRGMAKTLAPLSIFEIPFQEALVQYIAEINANQALNIQFTELIRVSVTSEQNNQVYRILQEIILNTIKHANASLLLIEIAQEENNLLVRSSDNGIGYVMSEIRAKNKLGLGLRAIHSRIDYLNGTLSMSDDINKGTRYVIRIPLTTSPNA